jgi:hypothetical protein
MCPMCVCMCVSAQQIGTHCNKSSVSTVHAAAVSTKYSIVETHVSAYTMHCEQELE